GVFAVVVKFCLGDVEPRTVAVAADDRSAGGVVAIDHAEHRLLRAAPLGGPGSETDLRPRRFVVVGGVLTLHWGLVVVDDERGDLEVVACVGGVGHDLHRTVAAVVIAVEEDWDAVAELALERALVAFVHRPEIVGVVRAVLVLANLGVAVAVVTSVSSRKDGVV